MLNFRNTNMLFGGLLLLSITAKLVFGASIFIAVLVVVAYSLILFYGCYNVGSNFFIPVICAVNTGEKVIAITFDDGPVAANTIRILNILNEKDVKAAFFCIGNRIPGNEAILKQIDTDGHLIGNHSYSHHFFFDLFSAKKMLADVQSMDEAMCAAIGKTPKLFRPPYGVTNPNLKKAIIEGAYQPIGWSVRSMDTVIKNEVKLLKKISGRLKPGAIFLFHDTTAATIAILPAFIDDVKTAGYSIVRLDKLLNLQAYA